MPRFRVPPLSAPKPDHPPAPVPLTGVRAVIAEVLHPAHFFVGPGLVLEWVPPTTATVPWEVFQGRLLDAAFTRQRRSLETWDVFAIDSGARSVEPILSVKLDVLAGGQLHVTRAIHCYAWEGYDAGGNVYLTRETQRWQRELVGTLDLGRFADAAELRAELVCRLFQAVVGTSRLPLTSVEAPLPAFSLGRLAYFYRPHSDRLPAQPMTSSRDLLDLNRTVDLAWVEKAKLLETLLHVTPPEEIGQAAEFFATQTGWLGSCPAPALLLTLFNEVSLSPYTDLAGKTLALLHALEEGGRLTPAQVIDFLGRLLRQLGRHLTAYDLVTFHHRGANYPDALLLDALLAFYLSRIEEHPDLFLEAGAEEDEERQRIRLRRRALRQSWLLRSRYEGHPVPDAPTSQGENLRILPAPHARVPEEQILQPGRRTKRLFAGAPLAAHLHGPVEEVLRQSLRDLAHPHELRELGSALFLDRPLGAGKAPVEPDATPLFSHEAFSRSLAERRLEELAGTLHLLTPEEHQTLRRQLAQLQVDGIPLEAIPGKARPGVVSLADARQVAADFVFRRTTARALFDFLDLYDFTPLSSRFSMAYLSPERRLLILGAAPGRLLIYDAELRPRLELAFDPSQGYESGDGFEYPVSGLRVLRLWDESDTPGELREHDLCAEEPGWCLRTWRWRAGKSG